MTSAQREKFLKGTALGTILSTDFLDYLSSNGFYTAPASTKYHGNYEGGLFDHSFAVMTFLVELSAKNNLRWKRVESPFIVGMFHDLCKIDQYQLVTQEGGGALWEYNNDTRLTGHGSKSVALLNEHMTLTEEEEMCILYHMGAFTDASEWSMYTDAINRYQNVLWTHHADMLASHVVGI